MDHEFVSEESERLSWNTFNTETRMALIELRIFVAAMALNYTWTGVPDTPGKWDDEMTTFESAVIQPRRGKCVIDIKAKNPSI